MNHLEIDSDLNQLRDSYCPCCEKITEQRIDERYRDWFPDLSPTFDYYTESVECWWCNECDEHVSDIQFLK